MLGLARQLKILNVSYYTAVAGLVVALLYESWKLGNWYLYWPTYMKTEIVEQMQAEFPAVTICKLDPVERNDGGSRNCTGLFFIISMNLGWFISINKLNLTFKLHTLHQMS